MKVSIVIGSHNRSLYLEDVIRSCKELDYPNFEIIVIDSALEPLPKEIQKICDQYFHDSNMIALSLKRNLGIEKGHGDVIVFTDDDCIVDNNWLKELVEGLKKENVMCCTGRTLCHDDFKNTEYEKKFAFKSKNSEEMFRRHSGFQNILTFGHGNNMAFKKEVFAKVGLFDNNLGVGTTGMTGEDTDMFYCIYKKGFNIFYNPKAVVYHKHLVKDEDVPNIARRNGLGGFALLKKYRFDLNYLVLYFGVLVLALNKIVFGKTKLHRKIGRESFLGWLGVRKK